jgi:signal transduction histidine kinase
VVPASARRAIFRPPAGVVLKEDAARNRASYPAAVTLERFPRPRTREGLTAAGFALAAAVEAVVRSRNPAYLAVNLTGAPLLLVLAVRRARPLLALLVLCAGAVVGTVLQAWLVPRASSDAFVPILGVLLAVYSVGAHGSGRAVALGAPLPLLVVVFIDTTRPHSDSLLGAVVFFAVFVIALPMTAGRLVRHRTLLVSRLEAQAVELDEQRAAHVAAALARERVRMAAELDIELADGMQQLLHTLERGATYRDSADVEAVERQARGLLAATREVVVTLTAASAPPASSPMTPRPDSHLRPTLAEVAQPWTCLFAASVAAGLLLEIRTAHVYVPRPAASVAVVVMAAPLALAWARPLLATVLAWGAAALVTHQVTPLQHLTTPIALTFVLPFVVAALEPRRRAITGLLCCWVGVLALDGAHALAGNAVVAGLCWALGTGLRNRIQLVNKLQANNVLLEQGRAALTADALSEERGRLARELHDALGHSLTVVALQAGAARRIWDTDRAKAEAMLATTRAAVVEGFRELQGSLAEAAGAHLSVHHLIAQAQAVGVQVTARLGVDVDALPEPHRLAVYRTVQEALTNAVKHSPGAAITIALRCADGQVEVDVTNGPPSQQHPHPTRSRHGLVGMRHRLERLGGTLSHELSADGGFRLRAQLPTSVGAP